MARGSSAPPMQSGQITNFAGGPNFRDSPTELAAIESYGAYNCTFDERGGVASRLGFIKRNLTPIGTGFVASVLAASPKLYWRFTEAAGASTAQDTSNNGHTGSYNGGITLGESGAPIGAPATSALFDNATGVVTANSYQPFQSASTLTFMGWAYRSATTDDDGLLSTNIPVGGHAPPGLWVAAGSGDVSFTSSSSVVTWTAAWPGTAQWVHWALTYNDTTRVAELFINGVSKGQLTLATSTFATTTLIVGNYSGKFWNGFQEEFAVFESILAAATISSIYAGTGSTPPVVVNDFYSPLLGITLTQAGTGLYKSDSTLGKTFSTSDCITFTEFSGVVVACHPVDGLWTSSDGATWAKITAANAPTTNTTCVAAWQGRLFVGMSDGSVHWSDPGTLATWTANNFVNVWEKDAQPIVALHVGSGQDIVGKPGLLVFKQDSVYRMNDPTTGAYVTIDANNGAAGPKAVVGVGARVCWVGKHGIFWWREDKAEPVNASDLLHPVWRTEQLSYANQAGWAAGRRLNRAYFSVSSLNSNVNDLAFELHPDQGWIAPRSDAMSCYSTSRGTVEQTYGGSPTAGGQVYQLDTGGLDDVDPIAGWFQTRWLIPNGGSQAQIWQARLHGRGSGTMTVRQDYEDSGGTAFSFDFSSTIASFKYDNGILYDSGATYGTVTLAESESFAGLGACRQFSLRFDFSVDSIAAGRSLFGNTSAPAVGAFGLYAVDVFFVPLGLS